MYARIYDFDPSYDPPDGEDDLGEYVVREVDYLLQDGHLMLKNGLASHAFKFIGGIAFGIWKRKKCPQCLEACERERGRDAKD